MNAFMLLKTLCVGQDQEILWSINWEHFSLQLIRENCVGDLLTDYFIIIYTWLYWEKSLCSYYPYVRRIYRVAENWVPAQLTKSSRWQLTIRPYVQVLQKKWPTDISLHFYLFWNLLITRNFTGTHLLSRNLST